jgi:hypothetical protein
MSWNLRSLSLVQFGNKAHYLSIPCGGEILLLHTMLCPPMLATCATPLFDFGFTCLPHEMAKHQLVGVSLSTMSEEHRLSRHARPVGCGVCDLTLQRSFHDTLVEISMSWNLRSRLLVQFGNKAHYLSIPCGGEILLLHTMLCPPMLATCATPLFNFVLHVYVGDSAGLGNVPPLESCGI